MTLKESYIIIAQFKVANSSPLLTTMQRSEQPSLLYRSLPAWWRNLLLQTKLTSWNTSSGNRWLINFETTLQLAIAGDVL